MEKLVVEGARISNEPKARLINNKPVMFARVLFLGGSVMVPNPDNLQGDYKKVEIGVELGNDAREWKSNDGRSGAMLSIAVRPVSIISVVK